MLPRWDCLVPCLISLVVANHQGGQGVGQDGLGGDHDNYNGDIIVIEHRHRPRVHKSYGSGQYVIPAGALLPQPEHYLGDDQHYQGAEESGDDLGRGGEVYDGALEATADYYEDYSMDDNELFLAESFDKIPPATQDEDGKYVETREKAQTHDHMVGGEDVRFILGENLGPDQTAGDKDDKGAGQSGRVAKKEGSRTALSKLLRLLITAYI